MKDGRYRIALKDTIDLMGCFLSGIFLIAIVIGLILILH